MNTTFRARVARTGRQEYETGPEWRDASQVFASASLVTLDNVRVQVSHDAGAPQVGYVRAGSAGRVQGPDGESYLTAELVITDASTIAAIRRGELKHISCGYACEHVVRDGRKHQTDIRFDHVALLRRDIEQPRCGTHCAVTDRQDMTTRHSDALQLEGCNCGAQHNDATLQLDSGNGVIPDAIVHGVLDAAAQQAGVSRQTIIDGTRNYPKNAHLTFEMVRQITFEASLHGGKLLASARDDGATVANDVDDGSDESFRRMLARKAGA